MTQPYRWRHFMSYHRKNSPKRPQGDENVLHKKGYGASKKYEQYLY